MPTYLEASSGRELPDNDSPETSFDHSSGDDLEARSSGFLPEKLDVLLAVEANAFDKERRLPRFLYRPDINR
jgi:hypothetical protein